MYMVEISAELQNAETSLVTILKADSTRDAFLVEILRMLTGNICGGISFQCITYV